MEQRARNVRRSRQRSVRSIAISLAVIVATGASAVFTSTATAAANAKLCHVNGAGVFRLLSVNENAVPGHLRHGDGVPGGAVPGRPGLVFGMDCSIVSVYEAAVLADGPIHYWRFEEASSAEPAKDDGTVGGQDGTYTGGASVSIASAAPSLGRSLALDGEAGSYVDVGMFHPGSSVTVEAWVWLSPTAVGIFHAAVARWAGSYELDVNDLTGGQGNFVVADSTAPFGFRLAEGPLVSRGTWHHLAGVFDGTTLQLYVDGVPGAAVMANEPLADAGPEPDRVLLGATRSGADEFSYNWTGFIDEVAIYDHALSAAQINAHRAAGGSS